MEIKDYTFKTKDPMPTNAHNMECFLNSDEHFYAVFPRDSEVTFEDGSYAEVTFSGKTYALHASGDGDFYNHRIRFELLQNNNPCSTQ